MQPYFNDWWQWEGVCLALSEGVRSGRQALPKGKRAVTVGPRAQCLSQVLGVGNAGAPVPAYLSHGSWKVASATQAKRGLHTGSHGM